MNAVTFLPIIPPFVIPHKRYAGPTLLHLAVSYLENDRQSYRETAAPKKRAIGYQGPLGEERGLAHSTIWRIVTWIGGQVAALTMGRCLIQGRDPSSTCHRFVGAVAPRKSRSWRRLKRLCRARQLLSVIVEWKKHFSEHFFPRFATKSGFP